MEIATKAVGLGGAGEVKIFGAGNGGPASGIFGIFGIHEEELEPEFLLGPVEDEVDGRSGSVAEFGDAFNDDEAAGDVLGEVAMLKVRDVGMKVVVVETGMGETDVADVGNKTRLEGRNIFDVVGVGPAEVVSNVDDAGEVDVGIRVEDRRFYI